jgi:archaeosine synthase beta-subunit
MTIRLPISDQTILDARPAKNAVDPFRPYAYLVEPEYQRSGDVEDVAVVFLTNRECPFRCLMCDLWKNTTDEVVPVGAIPQQIDFALRCLPPTRHIKLYNSGNFFDPSAIPVQDYDAIAERVKAFSTVIVENHPSLVSSRVPRFLQSLRDAGSAAYLEVAMGLETIHPTVLPLLNKQMSTDSFRRACDKLLEFNILLRAFVLLRPPTLSESEGVEWAYRSTEFAFDCGVHTVSIIPTRAGNGIMEQLQAAQRFSPPTLDSMEAVFESTLALNRGRVFIDLWDAETAFRDAPLALMRIERLNRMNLGQKILAKVNDE